jgi:hypothetical protein
MIDEEVIMNQSEALLRKSLDGLRKITHSIRTVTAPVEIRTGHIKKTYQGLQIQPTYSVAVLLCDVTVIPDIRPALQVLRRIQYSSSITYEYELPNHRT